ncbi:aldehyde-activating protein [Alteromonas aestuariivivens]|uniref:Aldehyde-activating protein n=1 Tax=Alteromonas aestuariivivens TaxID=1938339 RepID=A0A3D8ME70_9ALTE|nr:GFA family protein [Alteromonas aestuariivivens]RDV29125.1 aldehyde-activating protein [Alteromonas aestuariivivens]
MERKAQCMCGKLTIQVRGDPSITLACNCQNCQRRTGSVFGVGAYFDNHKITGREGTPKSFRVATESGNSVTTYFCSNCGSTLYIEAEMFTGMTGIPVGCFTDPGFPEPTLSAWNQSKYDWVQFPEHWLKLEKQAPNKS